MVTECPICKLPRFHGAAGYAGPQCKCQFATLPQMHDKLRADFDAQAAELAEARALLQECRTTFEMWKDVAPAHSLCKDLDAFMAK